VDAAIYAKLVPGGTLDATLASLGVTGVFDIRAVPTGQPLDYVTIGDTQEVPMNVLQKRGYTLLTTLHIWTQERGTKTADAILARLNTLLDQQSLTLATHNHVGTYYEQSLTLPQNDVKDILHMTVRYQIITQEQ
jgi:hypothetical protein